MPEKITDPRRPPWELVLEEMVSVDLTISRWRGRTKLDLQGDLGLIDCTFDQTDAQFSTYQKALREVVYGGQRTLLPRPTQQRLERIERAARALLVDLSFQTGTMFGNLMPKANYAKFVERLTKLAYDEDNPSRGSLAQDFFAMRDEIVTQREQIAAYVRRSHRNLAVVAWRLSEGLPITDERPAPAEWVKDYLDRVVAALPAKDRIYASFQFDWTVSEIPVPEEAVKQVKLDALERQQKRLDQEIRALETARARVQSEAESKATLEVERSKREAERTEAEARLADARREKEKVERDLNIQREIGQKAKARIERDIAPALEEITNSVRSMLYEATLNALAAVKKNGKVPPQTAGALKRLIARADDLNWMDDAQIALYLAQLREVATEMTGLSDGDRAEEALREAATYLRAELIELGATVRSGREVGVADVPEVVISEYGGRRALREEVELPQIAEAMEQRQARKVIE